MSKLIAVYGSLRKGFHNHRLIEDSKFLGEFKTPPVYNLFSLGSFPGLHEGGTTSVLVEVYEVTPDVAANVDLLEGYDPDSDPERNFYNKKMIDTPYGKAGIYLYNGSARSKSIESGDWATVQEKRN